MIEKAESLSKMPFLGQLADTFIKALPRDLVPPPRIVFCDRADDGRFQRFAGLARVRRELLASHGRNGGYPSILILGMFPVADGASPQERELAALLRWPGIAHLPYGFTTEQLIAAAREAIKGAKAPLPPGILPTVEDILRVTSEVRHWLENRLHNTKGALVDFRNAAHGNVRLHSAHLEPMVAISQAHRQMLDRLWALEAAAKRFAPWTGGSTPIKVAIVEFETNWQGLEAVRADIRSRGGEECAELLGKARQELERVCRALAAAIDATNGLSKEVATTEGR